MNPFQSRHCSACGTELGLEPREHPSSFRCPACKVELAALESGVGSVLDCTRCGGQFVEHPVLRDLLGRKPLAPRAASGSTHRAANPIETPVVYRACPRCAQLMNRKNFGGRSGIIVDVCSLHGTWFEAEELPSVLAFVERGGLERAQRLERAERRGTAHETRVAQLGSSGVPSTASAIGDLALDGVLDLLHYVIARVTQ